MGKLADTFILKFQDERDEKKRLEILAEFVNLYYDSDMVRVNAVLEKELVRYAAIKDINGEAMIRFMLAYSAMESAQIARGEAEIKKVMGIFHLVTSHVVRAQILNFQAFMHSHLGNFDQAFRCVYDCIREAELSDDFRNRYWGMYTLAVLHYDLKDLDNAEKYYSQAGASFKEAHNEYGLARCENGLASVAIQREKYEEAESLLERTLAYYQKMEVSSGESRSLNDLALVYRKRGQIEKALECFKGSLRIRKETNHLQGVATSLNEIAELLLSLKRYDEAEIHLSDAKNACEQVQNRAKLYRTHFLFSQLYRAIDKPWKALEHYELYDKLKTEVTGETASNKIKELQARMATEKSEKEAEIERLKNVELKNANELISEKQKEILASIHYAKRIQLSLLPTEKYIERTFARMKKK